MTFVEFADRIKSIFRNWDVEVVDDTIKLRNPDIDNILFVFKESEFNQLFDINRKNSSNKSLEIYRDNYYEVLLQSDSYRYVSEYDCKEYSDEVNKIKYYHGEISENLVFWMLCNGNTEMLTTLFRQSRIIPRLRVNELFQEQENSLLVLISKFILRKYNSLIIEFEGKIPLPKVQSYMYAYVYTYMYNKQTSIYPCFELNSLFPQRINPRRNGGFDYPKKIYNQELISYYNEAISSSILSHKYLSFYHILEYFYENIFMEDQISKAKEILTDVGFSYKRNKDIAKLIKNIQSKAIDKDVAINEKSALSLLIQKHIKQEQLKEKLIERYEQDFLEELKHKVEFSDGNIIIFSNEDEKQYIDSLTNRIYKTRNAIVHSKESFTEGKKNNKYQPIKDDKELFTEIELIQVVAEIIINEDSKPI